MLAPACTVIEIRVCELQAAPGEAIMFCDECKAKLAFRSIEVAERPVLI